MLAEKQPLNHIVSQDGAGIARAGLSDAKPVDAVADSPRSKENGITDRLVEAAKAALQKGIVEGSAEGLKKLVEGLGSLAKVVLYGVLAAVCVSLSVVAQRKTCFTILDKAFGVE